ncbi:hypothetical protein PVAP13_3KG030627 [Panicum virgatum]|uniref:Uncharacterized protein n=1 Tax=Panicum virgatum TaxID=38727 RepID=A0A8T0ULM6_PANVG|nr:hypothetical protein PVAP13_3KG030627 [Panicum virgatum]
MDQQQVAAGEAGPRPGAAETRGRRPRIVYATSTPPSGRVQRVSGREKRRPGTLEAAAEQQAYWWAPGGGGPKVNDRDLLEFDLFVEMHLRQQLLSRLQRPAAAMLRARHAGRAVQS